MSTGKDVRDSEKYKLLFENMTSGVLLQELIYEDGKAVDARIINANKAYYRHTGITREDIVGKRLKQVYPDYREELFRKLVDVVEKGSVYESDEYLPQFNRYLRIAAHRFDRKKYVVIFDDITAEVKTREEIGRSEKKFRDLFRNMVIGVIVSKIIRNDKGQAPHAVINDVNPAFERIAGKKAADLVGMPLAGIVPFCEQTTIEELTSSIIQNRNYETEVICSEDDTHFRMIAFPIGDDQFVLSVQDITEEKREFLARHHLASIVESTRDAIYSQSLDAKIMSWNRGASKFYGYSEEEIVGQDISILTPDLDHDEHLALLEQVEKGNTIHLEITHRTKYGKEFPVVLTKSPIFNRHCRVVAVSNIVKDISTIREREAELIQARERAEEAGKMKTAFLQNVSHEIRTPMNSILGFTEILKKRIGNGENSGYIQAIEESGKQLLRIIDDILDISRMETDELNIYKATFDLHKLLIQIREQFEGMKKSLDKGHIELELQLPGDEQGVYLNTDRQRLRQVLDNLLSNAVKYTDKGKIVFGYRSEENDLLFFVKDTGRGIPKSHQEKIFGRFNRVEDESTKAMSGTGLGLSISRGLVRKLGGEIWFESSFGKGTTFFFTIPSETNGIPEEIINGRYEKDVKAPDLEGKTILVAEDDIYSLQMLLIMLAETRADVLYAKNGREALDIIQSNRVDMALLDIRLPVISGYELLEKIREINGHTIPIAQTAYAMPEETRKILKAGFREHLKKPISSDALFTVLNKYFFPK